MAEMNINTNNKGGRKKSTPSRMNLRVDFTPMVDMNMLLITFFMFCTTLITPQVMEIVMPTKERPKDAPLAPESRTITLLLSENEKIYYYFGKLNYEDPELLKVTDYSNEGLRSILLERNVDAINDVRALKQQRLSKQISEEIFKEEMSRLKKSKEGQIVIIKPTHESAYKDLVRALDEMQICSINTYAIVEPEEGDWYLLDNYKNGNNIAKLNTKQTLSSTTF